jgi:threonylcarbamoyladenosine tRNA methylthiotransferase MtaB
LKLLFLISIVSLQLMNSTKSVAFHTLGCKLNYSETSTLSRMMENEGFEKKEFSEIADVYVINTCSVTDNADKECRMLVRRLMKKSPQSLVVTAGGDCRDFERS